MAGEQILKQKTNTLGRAFRFRVHVVVCHVRMLTGVHVSCTFPSAGLEVGLGEAVTVALVLPGLVFSEVAHVDAEITKAIKAK